MDLRAQSLVGLVLLVAIAWALSNDRRRFPWRTAVWGIGLQFLFALFILKTPVGTATFFGLKQAIDKLNDFALEGGRMVFGPLVDPGALGSAFGPENGFIFAVMLTASIVVISAFSTALYHYGILQRVVGAMAWVMRRTMGTSGSESLAAASNIFLGQTEAALVVKPYLAGMTPSELMALMVTGMATIATGVLGVYAGMGIDGGHLVTASVLSAPAGLFIAKVMFPETRPSQTGGGAVVPVERTTVNGLDALCRGAGEGVVLSLNVIAMLIAFVATVALANHLLTGVQGLFGIAEPVTLQVILGWINWPFAWMLGVPSADCALVGRVLGERIVLNEFIGYLSLVGERDALTPRSFTLATYALCGFANLASIAIQIGGIGSLAPERRGDLARLGLKAMVGGVLACYVTATVVGVLI